MLSFGLGSATVNEVVLGAELPLMMLLYLAVMFHCCCCYVGTGLQVFRLFCGRRCATVQAVGLAHGC